MTRYILQRSSRKDKKWMVTSDDGIVTHFGASGYSDYTLHKDAERKCSYIKRHGGKRCNSKTSSTENWTRSGIDTAGFWSRWLLWGEKSIRESIISIENRFSIKIVRTR